MPPPDCAQWSRVGSHSAFTTTGTPCSQASMIDERERLERGGRDERGGVAAAGRHLVGSSTGPGHHDVGVRLELERRGDRAHVREGERARAALLVAAEERVEHRRALVVLHPPEAEQVGAVADPEDVAAPPAALDRVVEAEAEDDLGLVGHRVDAAGPAGARRPCSSRGRRPGRRRRRWPGSRAAGSSWAAEWSTLGAASGADAGHRWRGTGTARTRRRRRRVDATASISPGALGPFSSNHRSDCSQVTRRGDSRSRPSVLKNSCRRRSATANRLHLDPVQGGRPLRQRVGPAQMVDGAGRVGRHLEARLGRQVLGQPAGGRLRHRRWPRGRSGA